MSSPTVTAAQAVSFPSSLASLIVLQHYPLILPKLSTLQALVQEILQVTNATLAEAEKNNRALKHLCEYAKFGSLCAAGMRAEIPSMLLLGGVAVGVVLLMEMGLRR